MSTNAITQTNFSILGEPSVGKVRDMYDLGRSYLMVATDRLSAFDVVLPDPIEGKGVCLTGVSLFWFDFFHEIVSNHVIAAGYDRIVEICEPCKNYPEIEGRSILIKKADPLPVECIVRGYITGSGWKSYQKDGTVCGIALPQSLQESQQLPEPIFTPSTKEEMGNHDVNIDFDEMAQKIGGSLAEQVRWLSLELYKKGSKHALERGVIIADTKFEFGVLDGKLILIDEVLTPDSSRFWPKSEYQPGRSQPSYDKQIVRDYLTKVLGWDKKPPGPKLPEEIIKKTSERYRKVQEILTF